MSRPFNLKIGQLEEENARLRESIAATSPLHTGPRTSRLPSLTPYNNPSAPSDHTSPPRTQNATVSAHISINSRNLLFGETARQRQLEVINQESGELRVPDVDCGLARQLLSAFWNRQHSSAPVVYRTAFMRDMASGGKYFSIVLLNAMFFVSAKNLASMGGQCPATDSCGRGMSFRAKVEAELYRRDLQPLCKSDITTVQTFLLMSDALHSWCDEKSLSWHYLGIAINMIFDLELHTLRSSFYRQGSVEDQEVGRTVFWAAYVRDKQQSIYLGRPSRMRHDDCSISISLSDDYDELQPLDAFTYSTTPLQVGGPTRSISCTEQLCKLSVLAESILATLYSEGSYTKDAAALLRASGSLQAELDQWQGSLPAHLRLQEGPSKDFDVLPHTLSLMSMFYTLVILLHRPFVSDGHLQNIVGTSATAAFTLCSQAANGIDAVLRTYRQHFCVKSCPYFLSYATYVSGTIHVRVAAQSTGGSKAHLALWRCLETLEEQQALCHAPRQSMKILMGLVQRLNVDPGRRYNVQTSRSEAAEGNQPGLVPLTGEVMNAGTSMDTGRIPDDLDFDDSSLDIDAIINSFHASAATDAFLHATAGDIQSTSSTNTLPTVTLAPEEDAPNSNKFSTTDYGMVLDPLFGIDALTTDAAWFDER